MKLVGSTVISYCLLSEVTWTERVKASVRDESALKDPSDW